MRQMERRRECDAEAPSMIDDRTPWHPKLVVAEENTISEVSVFVTKSFSYVENDLGHIKLVGGNWTSWVPAPVAETAIANGYALNMDTPEGQKRFADQKEYNANSLVSGGDFQLRPEDCIPLGDVMNLMPPAEAAE